MYLKPGPPARPCCNALDDLGASQLILSEDAVHSSEELTEGLADLRLEVLRYGLPLLPFDPEFQDVFKDRTFAYLVNLYHDAFQISPGSAQENWDSLLIYPLLQNRDYGMTTSVRITPESVVKPFQTPFFQ